MNINGYCYNLAVVNFIGNFIMRNIMKNSKCNCTLRDLFYFDYLVMPRILTFIYWIVIGVVTLSGLSTLFMVGLFSGLITIVAGLIFTRITFEMIIVIFSINRNLEKLVELQGGSPNHVDTELESVKKSRQTKPKTEEESDR